MDGVFTAAFISAAHSFLCFSLPEKHTHKHTPSYQQLVLLVSPSVQDLQASPSGPGCSQTLDVEVLKNIIKCRRADSNRPGL